MKRADLHIHSRFSRRSPEWAFRRAGVSGSYSDPLALYEKLQSSGFSFFTLTDHHSIEGCLELEGKPGVFISEKVTARFPEDDVPVDVLVWGITPSQHEQILAARKNLYDLHRYLRQEDIAHAVAHPFFSPDRRLQTVHVEKMLLLFRHFESLNGLRGVVHQEFAESFLGELTPSQLEELANRHDIEPMDARPWEKVLVGGSGDQGGRFPGRAWTEVPDAGSVAEFLEQIKKGNCKPMGRPGGPVTVAHGLYSRLGIALGERFEPVRRSKLVRHALERFMEGRDPTSLSWKTKLELGVEGILNGQVFELLKPANASLWKALADGGGGESLQEAVTRRTGELSSPEDRAFQIANIIAGRLLIRFLRSFIEQSRRGNLMQALQDLTVLFPVLAPLAPYFLEFKREAPNRGWLQKLSRSVHGRDVAPLSERKTAWLTDTLEDVNGVSKTICKLAAAGSDAGFSVTVISCRGDSRLEGVPLKNFEPVGEFALPEYELQKLSFPPVLEIVEYIQREKFTEIILSTPGPVGLAGLLAARLLGLPVKGIYHTDFPRYVRILTDDSDLESLTWTFMHWFYTGLDALFVNSEPYREAWINRGADPHRVRILPRGMDVQLFNPERRRADFWRQKGAGDGQVVLLYVGRVSREKDLDMLVPVMAALRDLPVVLAIVGDGPYQSELKRLMPEAIFTGYLLGEELARAYASSDIFVFPSTTDTYGNVVVEALASGLPCVVSSEGGPSGLVQHGRTGFVTKARDVGGFASRLRQLAADGGLRKSMSENAVLEVLKSDWTSAAESFFSEESSPLNRGWAQKKSELDVKK